MDRLGQILKHILEYFGEVWWDICWGDFLREFALASDASLRVFWVGFGSKCLAWPACLAAPTAYLKLRPFFFWRTEKSPI